MRYGFTTHCLIASTIATAPTIVTTQSIATRQGAAADGQLVDGVSHARSSVRRRLWFRRHSAIRPWSPESRPRGRSSPETPLDACTCWYSSPPSSSDEKLSSAPDPSSERREPPRHRVCDDHRGQLTAREDVRPDRDRVGREVLEDALVEALEPAESSVRCSSPASSSTTPWSSWRPCGVSATTRWVGSPRRHLRAPPRRRRPA